MTLAGTDAEFLRRAEGARLRQPLPRREGRGLARRLADTRGAGQRHLAAHRRARRRPPRRPPRPRAPAARHNAARRRRRRRRPRRAVRARAAQVADRRLAAEGLQRARAAAGLRAGAAPASSPAVHAPPAPRSSRRSEGRRHHARALGDRRDVRQGPRASPACCYVDLNLQAGAAATISTSPRASTSARSPPRRSGSTATCSRSC